MATQDSHGSRGSTGVIVAVVSTSIAFVALVLRVFTRAMIVRNFGSEDWVILLAFALSVALTALICVEVQHGQGRHLATISPDELKELYKAFWASVPVYQASLSLTKISILLQYRRVFVGSNIQRAISVFIGVIVVYGIWSVLSTTFMCSPVAYFWDSGIIGGHCLSRMGVWFANASLNIVTDVGICVLPMPVLNKLQLPRKQKYALMAVFGLGLFVCLTSILRLKSLYDISVSKDVTWDNTPAAYWSSLEANFSIIAACLPTLRKTISRFFPRIFSSHSHSDSHRHYLTSRRTGTHTDTNGFKRFPVHAAESDWVQGLATQTTTARDISHKIEMDAMRKQGSTSACSSDDGRTVVGEHDDGRIRVMTTITTCEVSPSNKGTPTGTASSASSSPSQPHHL